MDLIALLRRDYYDWVNSLSQNERYAIRKYSFNSFDDMSDKFYSRLNAMLRGDIEWNENYKKYAQTISNALKKITTKRSIICYRGVDVDPVAGFEVGDIFKLDQFVSTSVIKSRTLKKDYEMIIIVPSGIHAAYIEQISYYPKQRELLLDKDCVYRLKKKKDRKIHVEVIL